MDLKLSGGKRIRWEKTVWKDRFRHSWSFFCPSCREFRTIPFHPRPGGMRHWLPVFFAAVFFTLMTWNWFAWKGIVSIIPFWTLFEMIYRMRVRAVLKCRSCGFDPYLYLVDVKRARQEITDHWKKVFQEKGIPFPTATVPASSPGNQNDGTTDQKLMIDS